MRPLTMGLRLLPWVLLMAAALPAQARIDPLKRCTLTLSPAEIDHGQVSHRQSALVRQAGIVLPSRTLFLNLVCPQPINLTMLFHAPSLDPRRFDFGGGGAYTLRVHDVRVDGLPALIGLVTVPGEPPTDIAEQMAWAPEHAWVPIRVGMQAPGSTLSALIDVDAVLDDSVNRIREARVFEVQGMVDVEDARESVTLTMRAEATPRSCTPRLTPGTLDLGTVSRTTLRQDAATALVQRSVQLQLNCSGPTLLGVKLLDNRGGASVAASSWAGVLPQPARFALSPREGGVAGVYALSLGAVIADGQMKQVLQGTGEVAAQWRVHEDGAPLQRFDAQSTVYAFGDPGHVAPVPVENLSVPINVDVQLAPASQLAGHTEVLLDGSVTIEIVYL